MVNLGSAYETIDGRAVILTPGESRGLLWQRHELMCVTGFALISEFAASVVDVTLGNRIVSEPRFRYPSKVFRESICRQCNSQLDFKAFLTCGVRWQAIPGVAIHAGMSIQAGVLNHNSEHDQNVIVLLRGVVVG